MTFHHSRLFYMQDSLMFECAFLLFTVIFALFCFYFRSVAVFLVIVASAAIVFVVCCYCCC